MNTGPRFLLMLPLACLLGCTLPYTPTPLAGNWQIQAGTAITSPPTAPYLIGALQGSDSALTGTFNLQQPGSGVTPQVISLTGTYNPTTSNLVLVPPPPQVGGISVMLSVPANPTDVAAGSIEYSCGVCNAIPAPTPAVGVQIAPLNGTYTGTLTGTITTSSQTTPISGTASVTFTQSATPNSSGQFPLTAAVTFPSSSGIGTTTLPGLVSGITIELSTEPCIFPFSNVTCNVIGPGSVLFAYTNPTATQITVTNLQNLNTSAITLTGTLTRQ
ncbi:MAG TPA: hypothetical protein VMQ60_13825 [Acidobacteriaceae bacterium]|nr:hypothetical protein [Acidobacteriaceae bacterium]